MHRTTFVGQAANLWSVKQRLHQHLVAQVDRDPQISLVDGRLAPANLADLAVGAELVANVGGWVLADRTTAAHAWPSSSLPKRDGCWPHEGSESPTAAATALADRQTPPGRDGHRAADRPLPPQTGLARDAWHLWSRWLRKLLSHTMAVSLCQRAGLGSLRFADLLTS